MISHNGGRMTEQELAAIEALANAATPGPWSWGELDSMEGGAVACQCEHGDHRHFPIIETDSGYYGPCQPDRAFIAASREAIPSLVAEVRRLRALVEGVKPTWNHIEPREAIEGTVEYL